MNEQVKKKGNGNKELKKVKEDFDEVGEARVVRGFLQVLRFPPLLRRFIGPASKMKLK